MVGVATECAEAAATYAALHVAAVAPKATLASARAQAAAAAAEAVAVAARATVDNRAANAQAATLAMCTHSCHSLFGYPHSI
jgi:hypothetical protein